MHDLWKVCTIEGVQIVGGAIGLCARLWKKHTQRVVGGAVGLVGGVHHSKNCGIVCTIMEEEHANICGRCKQ